MNWIPWTALFDRKRVLAVGSFVALAGFGGWALYAKPYRVPTLTCKDYANVNIEAVPARCTSIYLSEAP